jgi:glucan phosphorylase
VGYGGQTINTLRLWAAAAPDYFDFQQFSGGHFVAALAESLAAETLTRVLYPDDTTFSDHFSRYEPGVFSPLRDTLLTNGDHYMHLADLKAYLEADAACVVCRPGRLGAQGYLECGQLGKVFERRTIAEYAAGIWRAESCPVV